MKLTKSRLKEIIKEELLKESENASAWTIMYKGFLGGFKKSKFKTLESVAHAAAFLVKTEFGGGASKNDFIKSFKKWL